MNIQLYSIKNEIDHIYDIDGKNIIIKMQEFFENNDIGKLEKLFKKIFINKQQLFELINYCGFENKHNEFYYMILHIFPGIFNKNFCAKFRARMIDENIGIADL